MLRAVPIRGALIAVRPEAGPQVCYSVHSTSQNPGGVFDARRCYRVLRPAGISEDLWLQRRTGPPQIARERRLRPAMRPSRSASVHYEDIKHVISKSMRLVPDLR